MPLEVGPPPPGLDGSIVLLHGFTGSAAAWGEPVLDGLRRCSADVLPLDLPGHGADAGRADADAFTLTAALDGIDRRTPRVYDLVGYSMGGRIALHQVLRAKGRVRKLVLESASPGLEAKADRVARRRADERLAVQIENNGVKSFVDDWEKQPLFHTQRRLPEPVRSRHREERLANDPASLASALRGLGTAALPSLWHRLAEVAVDVLLVVGAEDEKFVEIGRRMGQRLPHARLEVVEGAGHTVHLERPDAWLDVVSTFLE